MVLPTKFYFSEARRLERSFYERYTVEVARELIGKLLIRKMGRNLLIGRIVEAEAYRGRDDPASHASRGPTQRSKIMFGRGGYAYIYFTYGNHYMFNVTTEPPGKPGAVLIRALEPLEGIEIMKKNRGVEDLRLLTSGPGRLTKAFGIDKSLNGVDLTCSDELFLADDGCREYVVESSPRIGVSGGKKRKWRFYAVGNIYVSRQPKRRKS